MHEESEFTRERTEEDPRSPGRSARLHNRKWLSIVNVYSKFEGTQGTDSKGQEVRVGRE